MEDMSSMGELETDLEHMLEGEMDDQEYMSSMGELETDLEHMLEGEMDDQEEMSPSDKLLLDALLILSCTDTEEERPCLNVPPDDSQYAVMTETLHADIEEFVTKVTAELRSIEQSIEDGASDDKGLIDVFYKRLGEFATMTTTLLQRQEKALTDKNGASIQLADAVVRKRDQDKEEAVKTNFDTVKRLGDSLEEMQQLLAAEVATSTQRHAAAEQAKEVHRHEIAALNQRLVDVQTTHAAEFQRVKTEFEKAAADYNNTLSESRNEMTSFKLIKASLLAKHKALQSVRKQLTEYAAFTAALLDKVYTEIQERQVAQIQKDSSADYRKELVDAHAVIDERRQSESLLDKISREVDSAVAIPDSGPTADEKAALADQKRQRAAAKRLAVPPNYNQMRLLAHKGIDRFIAATNLDQPQDVQDMLTKHLKELMQGGSGPDYSVDMKTLERNVQHLKSVEASGYKDELTLEKHTQNDEYIPISWRETTAGLKAKFRNVLKKRTRVDLASILSSSAFNGDSGDVVYEDTVKPSVKKQDLVTDELLGTNAVVAQEKRRRESMDTRHYSMQHDKRRSEQRSHYHDDHSPRGYFARDTRRKASNERRHRSRSSPRSRSSSPNYRSSYSSQHRSRSRNHRSGTGASTTDSKEPVKAAPIQTASIQTAPIQTAPVKAAPTQTASKEPIQTASKEPIQTAPKMTCATCSVHIRKKESSFSCSECTSKSAPSYCSSVCKKSHACKKK